MGTTPSSFCLVPLIQWSIYILKNHVLLTCCVQNNLCAIVQCANIFWSCLLIFVVLTVHTLSCPLHCSLCTHCILLCICALLDHPSDGVKYELWWVAVASVLFFCPPTSPMITVAGKQPANSSGKQILFLLLSLIMWTSSVCNKMFLNSICLMWSTVISSVGKV